MRRRHPLTGADLFERRIAARALALALERTGLEAQHTLRFNPDDPAHVRPWPLRGLGAWAFGEALDAAWSPLALVVLDEAAQTAEVRVPALLDLLRPSYRSEAQEGLLGDLGESLVAVLEGFPEQTLTPDELSLLRTAPPRPLPDPSQVWEPEPAIRCVED